MIANFFFDRQRIVMGDDVDFIVFSSLEWFPTAKIIFVTFPDHIIYLTVFFFQLSAEIEKFGAIPTFIGDIGHQHQPFYFNVWKTDQT